MAEQTCRACLLCDKEAVSIVAAVPLCANHERLYRNEEQQHSAGVQLTIR